MSKTKFTETPEQVINVDGRIVFVEDVGHEIRIVTPKMDSNNKHETETVPCKLGKDGKPCKWKKVFKYKVLACIVGLKDRVDDVITQKYVEEPHHA